MASCSGLESALEDHLADIKALRCQDNDES